MLVVDALGVIFTMIGTAMRNSVVSNLGLNAKTDTETSTTLLSGIIWLAILIILLVELNLLYTDKAKHIWIITAVLAFVLLISNFVEDLNKDIGISTIFGFITYICLSVGLTLISCWIGNQELFYETAYYNIKEKDPFIPKAEEKPARVNDTYTSQLKELKQLLDDGLITQEDYDKKKNDILGL